MADEISLNPEEEQAMDRAWDMLINGNARSVPLSKTPPANDPADTLIDKAVSAGVAISEETRARVRDLLKKK